MSAAHHILGMLGDIRRQREGERIDAAFDRQRSYIDRLKKRQVQDAQSLKQARADKRKMLEAYLHSTATVAALEAEIDLLRTALGLLEPGHPALDRKAVEAEIKAPARQRAYDSFHERGAELNAWLAR